MLHQNNQYNSNQPNEQTLQITELLIAKQRNGPIGSINLKFDQKCTKFFDINN